MSIILYSLAIWWILALAIGESRIGEGCERDD